MVDPYNMEIAPASPSLLCQNEEAGLCFLQNEVLNHTGSMHYSGAGNSHSTTLYTPHPVIPYPGGYGASTHESYFSCPHGNMVNASNVMPNRPRLICEIQQPQLNGSYMSYGHNFPFAYHYQDIGELIANNSFHNSVQNGNLYYPKVFDDSFHLLDFGGNRDASYQYGVFNGGISSDAVVYPYYNLRNPCWPPADIRFPNLGYNMLPGFSYSGHHTTGLDIEGGILCGACLRANLHPCNVFIKPQGSLKYYYYAPNDNILRVGGISDVRYRNGDCYKRYQVPNPALRPVCHSEVVLPNEEHVNFSRTRLTNTSVTRFTNEQSSELQCGSRMCSANPSVMRIANEQNCSGPQHRSNNTVCISPAESHLDYQAVRATGRESANPTVMRISNEQNCSGSQHKSNNTVRNSPAESHIDSQAVKPTVRVQSANPTVTRISDEPNGSGPWHRSNNIVRTFPAESHMDSQAVKATGSVQSGKTGRAQSCRSTRRNKNSAPLVQKGGTHSTPAPTQFWQKKKTQPSKSSSNQHSEKKAAPKHHIMWDGFDENHETIEPVGQYCYICESDLSYALVDLEFESSNLREVAVLSCGHALHADCLQLATSEEQSRDPPCYICANGLS